jgi:hypothetical protein
MASGEEKGRGEKVSKQRGEMMGVRQSIHSGGNSTKGESERNCARNGTMRSAMKGWYNPARSKESVAATVN